MTVFWRRLNAPALLPAIRGLAAGLVWVVLAVQPGAFQPPSAARQPAGPVLVRDAWIREAAATQAATAAYATLENTSTKPVTLASASVDGAGTVELHEMTMHGDVMTMVKVASIDIPAKSVVELAPGGRHLMLFELDRAFVPGGSSTLTFRFNDGTSVAVRAQIRKKSAMAT